MLKRAISVFVVLVLMFGVVGLRTALLCFDSEQAANVSSAKTIDITSLRGTVYDCKMNQLTNGEKDIYAAAKPDNQSLSLLKGKVLPDVFESVLDRMSKGNPVAIKVNGRITPTDSLITAEIPRRYMLSSLACHVIGYLNSEGRGISGIEKAYDGILSENNQCVRFRFSANAVGRVMMGEEISVLGNTVPKNGVVLTIDKDIQRITEEALDASGADCASAVIIDVENGAIRACVSRPEFNQNDIASSLNNEKSPLINRAFLPFSVGSVFKPVVAAAALENGIDEDFEYNCTGSAEYNGVTFHCHKDDGHGLINMKTAVAVSCNTYFITLALRTGADNILKTASDFGFGDKNILADGIESEEGNLPSADELDSKASIANLSFGQGSLLATPLQICGYMSAIARGGVYIRPYLIEGEVDTNGKTTKIKHYGEKRRVISADVAEKIRCFLEAVVNEGSGIRAKSEYVMCAGKTATAQTGKSENGEEIYNAWFAGYFPADNPKYALAILKENGGEGALSCAPVFKDIAEKVTDMKKASD